MDVQSQVALIILLLFGFLVWGRWRYDGVTLTALAAMVLLDLVSPKDAFLGFSHPAVITVALVLLISKALEKSGFINMIGDLLRQKISGEMQFLIVLMLVAAFLSSFMNNIGAMAMLLPITIGIAQKMEWNPSKFLMPLAFASILGGMNTKIGTPPKITARAGCPLGPRPPTRRPIQLELEVTTLPGPGRVSPAPARGPGRLE